jgi:hypothetical protein
MALVLLCAGTALAGPAAAVDDDARPDARVTHGPSCRPGGVVVEVTGGTVGHAVTLGTSRRPAGEQTAEVAPGAVVVLSTGSVDWGETIDPFLQYTAPGRLGRRLGRRADRLRLHPAGRRGLRGHRPVHGAAVESRTRGTPPAGAVDASPCRVPSPRMRWPPWRTTGGRWRFWPPAARLLVTGAVLAVASGGRRPVTRRRHPRPCGSA